MIEKKTTSQEPRLEKVETEKVKLFTNILTDNITELNELINAREKLVNDKVDVL